MLGKTFYNQSIRKILVAFGTLFNNINIERENTDGTTENIKIPLAYAPRARFVQRLNQAYDATEVQTTLPRMSFEWTDISYDSTRKLNTMQKMGSVYLTLSFTVAPSGSFTAGESVTGGTSGAVGYVVDEPSRTSITLRDVTGSFVNGEVITGVISSETATLSSSGAVTTNATRVSYRYQRVPYNMTLNLAVATRTTEDGLKIIEQILPFFTPEFTVTIRDVVTHDMPIVLTSVAQEDQWEGDFTERRFIIWTLDFETKAYLYGPPKDSNVITKTLTQLYTSTTLNSSDLTMAAGGTGTFSVDEVVFQGDRIDVASATGVVTSWNSSTRVLQITSMTGSFVTSIKVRGDNSGAEWTLSSITNLFESPTSTQFESAVARITQVPDPVSADADDDYDVTTTISENL